MIKICILYIVLILTVLTGCSQEVSKKWRQLGIPSTGIIKIYPHSNENGFYADYVGYPSADLIRQISSNLQKSGYVEVCSKFDGMVKGFQKGDKTYVLKTADLGEKVGISFFNEQGEEPLLYGLCFKGYQLSDPVRLR